MIRWLDAMLGSSGGVAAASQEVKDVHTLLRNGYAIYSAVMHATEARRPIPTEP